MLDNFGAHITAEVLAIFKEHKIHVVGIPPHSSELLQPLDIAINSALKKALAVVWAASKGLQLRFQSSKFGVQDWLKLLTSRQELTLPGSELVVTRNICVLNAGLSAANCKHSFEMAGITLDQAVQYHPEILDGQFDDDGLLRPGERLAFLVPNGVLKMMCRSRRHVHASTGGVSALRAGPGSCWPRSTWANGSLLDFGAFLPLFGRSGLAERVTRRAQAGSRSFGQRGRRATSARPPSTRA